MPTHPKLTKDGALLFQANSPLNKLDACSKLIFQNARDIFHHSIETDIDGNIWVPSSLYPQKLSVLTDKEKDGFVDDAIVQLSLMEKFFLKNLSLKSLWIMV